MILYRWQGDAPNFGDELNTLLWPKLLPGFFDDDPAVRFLGIGSVLDCRHPAQPVKLVAGSGFAGYEAKPSLDRTWDIRWVRGPRTASALGLPAELALGDPAALTPLIADDVTPCAGGVGYMPHFESAARGNWGLAASQAGIGLIDPRDKPASVIRAIAGCSVLLSEALHGVIVADALRVPWVAIRPLVPAHRGKWADWADTMDLPLRMVSLPASTLTEWTLSQRLASYRRTRTLVVRQAGRLEPALGPWLLERTSAALAGAARNAPQLSSDAALERCQNRLWDAVQALRIMPRSASGLAKPDAEPLQRLQIANDSA